MDRKHRGRTEGHYIPSYYYEKWNPVVSNKSVTQVIRSCIDSSVERGHDSLGSFTSIQENHFLDPPSCVNALTVLQRSRKRDPGTDEEVNDPRP